MTDITTSRRKFLGLTIGGVASTLLPSRSFATPGEGSEFRLHARPARSRIIGERYGLTDVWSYNDQAPGPELRVRVGQPVRVVVENGLAQDTSVHWHGIRLPNAMDGVPGLTQSAIRPGERFTYEFVPPDAGTFWYHPHVRGSEQVDRGLAGALIVEEEEPIDVDRDLTWILDDWRLTEQASISADFNNRHDASHAGRLGNVVTVNGQRMPAFPLVSGQRIRLRLINVANARNFALSFEQHQPLVIAIDGQPVAPHEPDGGLVTLGAAMRIDLLLDCRGAPGSRMRVFDRFYRRRAFILTELQYSNAAPAANKPPRPLPTLRANPLSEPDLENAETHELVLTGGAMGGMRGANLDGKWTDIRTLARSGLMWAMNGEVSRPDRFDPSFLTARVGSSHRIVLRNQSVFPHPMHLHGHHFRVIRRDSRRLAHLPWQDTVLVMPREEVEIAFRADNAGKWLFHCHVLEHMAAGMMTVVDVV